MLRSIVVFLSPSWQFRDYTSIATLLFLSKFHFIYYLFLSISRCDIAAGNVVKMTKILSSVEFEDLRAEKKNPSLYGITSCSPLKVNRCFGGKFRLLLKGRQISQSRIQLELDGKQICFTLVTSLAYSPTLNTKRTGSSETSFDFQRTTRRYIPRRENSSVAGYSCVYPPFFGVTPPQICRLQYLMDKGIVTNLKRTAAITTLQSNLTFHQKLRTISKD
jgi:hypothetical protein